MSTILPTLTDAAVDSAVSVWFGITKVEPNTNIIRERMRAAIAAATPLPTLPPLNDAMIDILGRVCFRCAGIADTLRASGQAIPRRAENEQAAVIYWLLGVYIEHGDNWAIAADNALREIVRVTRESTPRTGVPHG